MTENIWDESAIEKLGGEYNKLYNSGKDDGFSWVLDEDKEVLELEKKTDNSLKLNTDITSINLGLPSQVHGKVDEADFFLCLLNPRVQNNKGLESKEATLNNGKMSIRDYVEIEEQNEKEHFDEVNQYYKHITEDKNILSKETDKGEEIGGARAKELYYFSTYFHHIYDLKGKQMRVRGKDYLEKEKNSEKFDANEIKVCNLELFPYRTESKPTKNLFKKNKTFKDLKSSQYVAKLIIDRVLYGKKNKPFFVFRSYEEWFEVIKQELGKKIFEEISKTNIDVNNEKLIEGFEKGSEETEDMFIENKDSEIIERYDKLFSDRFYITSSKQNAGLTKNNIRKAPKYGPKISNNDYEAIQSIFRNDELNKKPQENESNEEPQNGK